MQNQIALFKIQLCYSKSDCVMQNQIVLCKIKLCYAKSNCVTQNQIVLFKIKLLCEIKLGYSNSGDIT